jgi:pyruvate formate lyase activating enzyme
MKQALYYKQTGPGRVSCSLCPHQCALDKGQQGLCAARRSDGEALYSLNYGQVTSSGLDPIEKKPLYHFCPGAEIYSLGSFGCNFKCSFCQNSSISQSRPATQELSVEELLRLVEKNGIRFVAFTYNEPLIWYEYVLECVKSLSARGVRCVLVTNGYIQPEPLRELLPFLAAMNIDLKSFSPTFYRDYPGGRLEVVLDTIRASYGKCHLELTNLVIGGLNDDEAVFRELVQFVRGISAELPLHISRYFPAFEMVSPATPLAVMERLYRIAAEALAYVYLGNVSLEVGQDTCCPACGEVLISRRGYQTTGNVQNGECRGCGHKIAGVWV